VTHDELEPCTASVDAVSGNITGSIPQYLGIFDAHCTISFTIAVDPSATPGQLPTALSASFPDVSPDPSATFIVLAQPLTIDPITLNVDSGQSVSGNLGEYVHGGVPPYTFTELSGPTLGTLTLGTDGTFTYQANPGASGADTFTFTVTDSQIEAPGAAATTTGTVSIVIAAPPASPTPTATLEPGVTPTVTPSPTNDSGVVGPGDPETPGATAEDARSTEPSDRDGGTVTTLPGTGTGTDRSSMTLFALLLAATVLLAGATVAGRRPKSAR
jgi:hypothetical protein